MSEWLEEVVKEKVKQETAALRDKFTNTQHAEQHIPLVFSLLSGRKILEACQQTQDSGKIHNNFTPSCAAYRLFHFALFSAKSHKKKIHQVDSSFQFFSGVHFAVIQCIYICKTTLTIKTYL